MRDQLWVAATEHPFVLGVRDGTVPAASFDRWLVQDYLFVGDLLWFQARLLARAPRAGQTVLAGGCVAVVAELDWFTGMAGQRGLNLEQDRLPGTRQYREFMEELDSAAFPTAVTALWALEQVYLDAWTVAGSTAGTEYREYAEHWTTPDFTAYVAALHALATPEDQQNTVHRVLEREIGFWETALSI